jgi:hypothetical protein
MPTGGSRECGGGSEEPGSVCRRGTFFRVKNDPSFALFDITPSPHRRINAPSWLLASAHTQGEAGTPTRVIGSTLVGRKSPVLCAGGVLFSM